ncbi:hypothetical protein HanRHA438_Chr10g0455031 [Helianthus annuus]|nr:hypothetical protein HanRHA438_Chr10g0455031 [Helianthus annuus]
MKLKHRGLKTCSKISRMSVRLVVRSRCSVNYDGTQTDAKTNQIKRRMEFCMAITKIKIF